MGACCSIAGRSRPTASMGTETLEGGMVWLRYGVERLPE